MEARQLLLYCIGCAIGCAIGAIVVPWVMGVLRGKPLDGGEVHEVRSILGTGMLGAIFVGLIAMFWDLGNVTEERKRAAVERSVNCEALGGIWVNMRVGGSGAGYSDRYCVDKSVILIKE